MTQEPMEVSADLAAVLQQLSDMRSSGGDDAKRAEIEASAQSDTRGFAHCQWLGACYYCFFAGKWWRIGCM